ncbi:MAG: hypothetical protein ACM3S1_08830 [Hyphomicrobiales bacterium]
MQEALEGRGRLSPELRALASVAAMVRELQPAGPGVAATARLSAAFEARLTRQPAAGWWRVLAPWLGAGPAPRPLVERLAAGVLVIGLIGGGGGAATGHDPLEIADGAASFVQSAVRNFDPRDGSGTPGIDVTPSPSSSPSPTPSPSATPVPSSTPGTSAGATATPDDHGGIDDEEHGGEAGDDLGRNRGPGGDAVDDHSSGDDD